MFKAKSIMVTRLLTLLFSLLMSTVYAQSATERLLHQAADPVIGNPHAPISIVEFFDYQCSHCIAMEPTLHHIIKTNPNVRIVIKEWPVQGPLSVFLAKAAMAAFAQGKFAPFNRALLHSNDYLSEALTYQLAKEQGLNVSQLKKDMANTEMTTALEHNAELVNDFGVTGTPAFIIGRTDAKSSNELSLFLGEMSARQLQHEIDKLNH